MLRRKVVTCDVCGKDITSDGVKYKFKRYENNYTNFDDFEHTKWNRRDMCDKCYHEFLDFIENRHIYQPTGADEFVFFCRVCQKAQHSPKCNLCIKEQRSGFNFSPYRFMELMKELSEN